MLFDCAWLTHFSFTSVLAVADKDNFGEADQNSMQEFMVDFVMEFQMKNLEADFRAREEMSVQENVSALQLQSQTQTQTQGVTQDFYLVY